MYEIEFRARISIYFLKLDDKDQIEKMRQFAERFVLTTSKVLYVHCQNSMFVYHPDEAAEAAGYYQNGVAFDVQKEVNQLRNFYNLAKIFEGLSGVLGIQKVFLKSEFELI